jgi:hypothetical protein
VKKLKTLLLVICLISLNNIQGQEHSTLAVPYSNLNNANYNDSGVNLNGIAYGWSAVTEYFISIPIPEGQPISLIQPWSPEHFVSSMTSDGINHHIIDVEGNFWSYYDNLGYLEYRGIISGFGDELPNGIAIDFSNNYNYYVVTDENLYQLFYWTTPMSVELIGSFGIPGSMMIDLAIDCCGNAYTYDIVTDQSYTVDLNTGEATLLGPIGFDANYGQGMSFDESSGQIFLSAFNDSTKTAQLRTLDIITGETTLIVDWGFEQIAPFSIECWCDYGNCKVGDRFEYDLCQWVITNEGGDCVWEKRHMNSNSYYLSQTGASGFLLSADSDQCGSGSSLFTTATMKSPLTAGQTCYYLSFDHDWRTMNSADEAHVEVSTDGGVNWETVVSWVGVDRRNTSEFINITSLVSGTTFLIRFRVIQPEWDWWWVIDNFCITECIPVEFISFTTSINNDEVTLNWSTATETNNQGFEIERRTEEKQFNKIGYVEGHSTTTETHYYIFRDDNISTGNYQYRLKQIDYDGTFEYSDIVQVEVDFPTEFSLAQNYPNPFNPATNIQYTVGSRQFVTLKVYDMLGNEIATLVNEEKTAGEYNVEFRIDNVELSSRVSAKSRYASGVYFYQLRAGSFIQTRKMLLIK